MSVSTRILFLIGSLAATYSLVMFGNMLHVFIRSNVPGFSNLVLILCIVVSIFVTIGFAVCWCIAIGEAWQDSKDTIFATGLCYVCAGFLFGVLAAPIATYGYNPVTWFSGWAFLLVGPSAPLLIELKNLLVILTSHQSAPSPVK